MVGGEGEMKKHGDIEALRCGDSVMADPFHALYNALADASNALSDVSGEYYYTSDLLAFRMSIDKHIDEALADIRSWRESIEEAT